MKTSSEATPDSSRRNLSPWVYVAINQAAFPGLGTILSGRRIGYVQAAIMLAGFFLTMAFMLYYLTCATRFATTATWTEAEFTSKYKPYLWALYWGIGCCIVAWIWSLFSSLQILKGNSSARR